MEFFCDSYASSVSSNPSIKKNFCIVLGIFVSMIKIMEPTMVVKRPINIRVKHL